MSITIQILKVGLINFVCYLIELTTKANLQQFKYVDINRHVFIRGKYLQAPNIRLCAAAIKGSWGWCNVEIAPYLAGIFGDYDNMRNLPVSSRTLEMDISPTC